MHVVTIIFLFLASASAQQSAGDFCNMKDGTPGICTELAQCQIVYQQLLAGKPPDTLCDSLSLFCCPLILQGTPTEKQKIIPRPATTIPSPVTPFIITWEAMEPGVLARQMCAQYAKSVYTLEIPPTLAGDRTPVNVSLCAIKSQKLIVGGTKAEPKEFPHMVAVGFDTSTGINWGWCGGTLVSNLFVLTAAHCTYSQDGAPAEWVRVGDLDLKRNNDDAKPQQRRVIKRIRHPSYKPPSQYHDIALLRMESPVTLDAWVRPACLPTEIAVQNAEKAMATGWGKVDWTDDGGSDNLLKVTLAMVPSETCNKLFMGNTDDSKMKQGIVNDWQICAGEEGKDTCQGDSGGPLVVFDPSGDCMYNVIGITSVGILCGTFVPGVYTRVYNYLSWLENEIWRV